jgi:hypothetical protein
VFAPDESGDATVGVVDRHDQAVVEPVDQGAVAVAGAGQAGGE